MMKFKNPFNKIGTTLAGFLLAYSLSNSDAIAQRTEPMDSIFVEVGKNIEGYKTRSISTPTWELKDGIPQVRDTIDLGKLYLSKNRDDLPHYIYGNGFGVEGTGTKFDTVLVKGEVYSWPEDTPINEAGSNIFGWANEGYDVRFLGLNYLREGYMRTDENGKFDMPVLMPTKKYGIKITGIKTETIDDKIPDNFELYQNYPNPFNAGTTIRYDLDKSAKNVELKIYDQLGKEIMDVDVPKNAGTHKVYWDGKKEDGSTLTSGVYFYNLKVDDKRETKSMVLLK